MRPELIREEDILAETSRRDDVKLAALKIAGAERRGFQAAMTVKYWGGSPRQAEAVFGWSRQSAELRLHGQRTGMVCLADPNQHTEAITSQLHLLHARARQTRHGGQTRLTISHPHAEAACREIAFAGSSPP
jgi:hypothetical protein